MTTAAGNIHDAIREHTAKTRVERKNYGFSLGKFGIGYSVEREEVVRPKVVENARQSRDQGTGDFAREMLRAMHRRMDFQAASGRAEVKTYSRPSPLAFRAAVKAYAQGLNMFVNPPQPSRLIAVA